MKKKVKNRVANRAKRELKSDEGTIDEYVRSINQRRNIFEGRSPYARRSAKTHLQGGSSLDMPEIAASNSPSVFAYIIRTVGPGYKLMGAVPWVSAGRVFFGACKKRMRPHVNPGDYVMGISGSDAGNPRRVLLWMKVDERMTFKEAYDRGKQDKVFRALRGTAIQVRPVDVQVHLAGDPNCYEHVAGAPHADEWQSDLKGTRDVFLSGGRGSWVAGANGPQVTETLIELLKEGITWRGLATLENPLTENARGNHVCLTGPAANQIISWVPRLTMPSSSSKHQHSACCRKCLCE